MVRAWLQIHLEMKALRGRLRSFILRWKSRRVFDAFAAWCAHSRDLKLKRMLTDIITKRHLERILGRSFMLWRIALLVDALEARGRTGGSVESGRLLVSRGYFDRWRVRVRLRLASEAAESRGLMRSAMSAWRRGADGTRRRSTAARRRRERRLLYRAFSNWVLWCAGALRERAAVERAIAEGSRRLCRRSMRTWRMHVAALRAHLDSLERARVSRERHVASASFGAWRARASQRRHAPQPRAGESRSVFSAWREASSILGLEREIFSAWKASRTRIALDAFVDEKAAVRTEGSLNSAYSRVLEECSALESMVKRLDDSRRSELERIEKDSAMIDFTLNELGMQVRQCSPARPLDRRARDDRCADSPRSASVPFFDSPP